MARRADSRRVFHPSHSIESFNSQELEIGDTIHIDTRVFVAWLTLPEMHMTYCHYNLSLRNSRDLRPSPDSVASGNTAILSSSDVQRVRQT